MSHLENKKEEYHSAVQTETNDSERSLDKTTCIDIIDTSLSDSKPKKIVIQVYGSDIRNKTPFKMGNIYGFFYYKGYPLLTLGVNCKLNILL